MGVLATILQVLLLVVGLFLMLIILLQRGRGGGLAGAFGGTGGQSAFGTKAGDFFTWLTVGTTAVWVLLAGVSGCVMRKSGDEFARSHFAAEKETTPDITTPEAAKEEAKKAGEKADAGPIPPAPTDDNPPGAAEKMTPPGEKPPETKPAPETPAATPPATPEKPAAPAPAETAPKPEPKPESKPEPKPETKPETPAPAPAADAKPAEGNAPPAAPTGDKQ